MKRWKIWLAAIATVLLTAQQFPAIQGMFNAPVTNAQVSEDCSMQDPNDETIVYWFKSGKIQWQPDWQNGGIRIVQNTTGCAFHVRVFAYEITGPNQMRLFSKTAFPSDTRVEGFVQQDKLIKTDLPVECGKQVQLDFFPNHGPEGYQDPFQVPRSDWDNNVLGGNIITIAGPNCTQPTPVVHCTQPLMHANEAQEAYKVRKSLLLQANPAAGTVTITNNEPCGVTLRLFDYAYANTPSEQQKLFSMSNPVDIPAGSSRTLQTGVSPGCHQLDVMHGVGFPDVENPYTVPRSDWDRTVIEGWLTQNSAVCSFAAAQPDVTINMVLLGSSMPMRGDEVVYRVNWVNMSQTAAVNQFVHDLVPQHLEYVRSSSLSTEQVGADVRTGPFTQGSPLSMDLVFKVRPDAPCGASIANYATVSSDNPDSNPTNNDTRNTTGLGQATITVQCPAVSSSSSSTPPQTADLSITKTGVSSVLQGQDVIYHLRWTNSGPANAQNVVVRDPVPSGLTFKNSSSIYCNYNSSTNSVDCAPPGPMGVGFFEADLVFASQSASQPCSSRTVSNTATVSTSTPESSTSNNVSQTIQTTLNCPIFSSSSSSSSSSSPSSTTLTVQKAPQSASVAPGNTFTYTLTTTNVGAAPAQNAWVSDTVTGNLQTIVFDVVSLPSGCFETSQFPNRTFRCSLGTMGVGDTQVRTLTFRLPTSAICGSVLSDVATAGADNAGIVTTGVATTNVQCASSSSSSSAGAANLQILKTAPASGTVTRGNTAVFTVTVANIGNAQATNVVVTDAVPAGLSYNVGSDGRCNVAGGIITCQLGTIAAGTSSSVNLSFALPTVEPCTATPTISNTATVRSDQTSTVTSGQATFVALCQPTATFEITKSDQLSTAVAGQTLTYVINVKNTSSVNATNVTVQDTLGSNLTFVSTPEVSIRNGQVVTWSGLFIPAGTTKPLTIIAQIQPGTAPGTDIVNTAQVTGGPTATDHTTVQTVTQVGCVLVTKEAVTPSGSVITPTPAFTFQLDGGQTMQNGSAGTATFTSVPVGQHTITEQTPAGWTLTTAQSVSVNVTTGSLCAQAFFRNQQTTQQQPTFTITKTDDVSVAQAGQTLSYRVVVTNTSSVNATNVTVTDYLPSQLTFQNASDGGTHNNGIVTWANQSIAANTSKTYTLNVQIKADTAAQSQIVNTAQVNFLQTATDTTTVQLGSQQLGCIQVTKEARTANGDLITSVPSFTFQLDGGSQTISNTAAGTAFFTSVPTGNHTVTELPQSGWTQTSSSSFTVNVPTGSLCAQVTFRNQQTSSSQQPSLTVTKTDDRSTANVGNTLFYRITVANNSSVNATNVTVIDPLPGQLSYVQNTANEGGFLNGQTVTWQNQFIPANGSRTYTFQATIQSGSNGTPIVNTAYASSASGQDTTTVQSGSSSTTYPVILNLSDSPDPVRPGDILTYSIEVRSDDPNHRTVDVRATLDPDTIFSSASTDRDGRSADIVNDGEIVWRNIGLSTQYLTLRVRVRDGVRYGDTLRLRVRADNAEETEDTRVVDSLVSNTYTVAALSVPVTVTATNGSVSLTKQSDRTEAAPNDTVFYTVSLRNTSNEPLYNVSIDDTFSSSQLVITDPAGGQVLGDRLQWTISTLNPGENRIFAYSARLSSSLRHGDTVSNTARVSADNLDSPPVAVSSIRVVQQLPVTGVFQATLDDRKQILTSMTRRSMQTSVIVWSSLALVGVGVGSRLGRRFFF